MDLLFPSCSSLEEAHNSVEVCALSSFPPPFELGLCRDFSVNKKSNLKFLINITNVSRASCALTMISSRCR